MMLAYRTDFKIVRVELSNSDSVAFFDGYAFATTANDEFLKVKITDLLYIE